MAAFFTRMLLLVVLSAIFGCGRGDPERELIATINAMGKAVQQREPAKFLESVADDFTRNSGGMSKQDVQRALVGIYMRNEKVHVVVAITQIRIQDESAAVKLRVVATGGNGMLPERGRVFDFDSHWRRQGRDWKVFNAEWNDQ